MRSSISFCLHMVDTMISDYHDHVSSPHKENTMRRHIAVILSATLLLCACSRSDTQPPAPKLFEAQRDTLDKAKEVGAMQLEAAEQQRKAMEQQTR